MSDESSRKFSFETTIDDLLLELKAEELTNPDLAGSRVFCPIDGYVLKLSAELFKHIKSHTGLLDDEKQALKKKAKELSFFHCKACKKYYYSKDSGLTDSYIK